MTLNLYDFFMSRTKGLFRVDNLCFRMIFSLRLTFKNKLTSYGHKQKHTAIDNMIILIL